VDLKDKKIHIFYNLLELQDLDAAQEKQLKQFFHQFK
jgi:hypothetical protein